MGACSANRSENISAIAMICVFVFFDMDEMTAVPLLPQPMIPTLMAELILDPKTISGFNIIAAEMRALFLINNFRFILVCVYGFVLKCRSESMVSQMSFLQRPAQI